METLAPPLELLIEIRFAIEKGQSLRKALQSYCQKAGDLVWRQELVLWLNLIEMGRSSDLVTRKMNFQRRQCLELLERGLQGESIYSQLCHLEEEILVAAKMEVEEFVASLPIKSLIPLLFFQFPAFLLLLLGSFLSQFLSQS